MNIIKGREGSVRIRRDGAVVLMDVDGRTIAIPWQAADLIADHLKKQARLAEEHDKAEQIIMDNAILHRAGAPFGFSYHPDIISETRKEAAWNSDLRRYMPGGVKASGIVYPPSVKKHKVDGNG